MLTIIVPIYNEEKNISILKNTISKVIDFIDYEVIFVDDGSTDNSLSEITRIAKEDDRIKYISFSKNYGHQNALRAGYEYASGEAIITMDGDGQHPVELIPQLIDQWKKGYQIVNTIRVDDKDAGFFKMWSSKWYYKIITRISEVEVRQGSADFRLVDRSICNIIAELKESNLFLRGMINWLGFEQTFVTYQVQSRYSGQSKFTFSKMINLALNGILSFSVRPLRLSAYVGFIVAILSFFYGVYAAYIRIFTNTSIPGWSSILLMVSLLGGFQLLMIGILGEYLGKLFMESKRRPNFIISKTNIVACKKT